MNGWVLLAPAGLIALAALAVPLLIHLLSRSRGERVLVGNIELFRQVRSQRASQIKLVQWLLLALRALILLVAALLLADLARQGLAPPVDNTAYVTPNRLAAAERGEAPIPDNHERLVSLTGGWAQLAEALAVQRHDGDVPVYTLASASDQPDQPLALPSPVTWLSDGAAVARAPSALNVLITHDSHRRDDAQAMAAALQAVAEYRDLIITVRLAAADTAASTGGKSGSHSLVWLSDTPVPGDHKARLLVSDSASDAPVPGGFVAVSEWPGLDFLASGDAADTLPTRQVLWRDAAGRALLVEQRAGGQRQLQFTQRLDLNANGPMSQYDWPDMLARLLLGEAAWQSGTENAALPADQMPAVLPELTRGQPARSVAGLLSLLLALLFLAERWLSERPRKIPGANE